MIRASVYLAVIVLSPAFANAQTPPSTGAPPQTTSGVAAAKGKVISSSNEPQAGVPVQIQGPLGQTVAITDKTGTWSLYNLPAGNYKVKMLGAQQTQASTPVDFTVKEASFWDRITGGAQKNVVWTPEIQVEGKASLAQ
jgi:hypothetical protein